MIHSLCVVDDNEIDIYQVSRIVKKSGAVEKFYSFSDGQEALDHFLDFDSSKNKFEGYFPPTVILLDINMPRMDGFGFLEKLSKLPKEWQDKIIIMMLTSSDQERDQERAKEFPNIKQFFIKPFTKSHFDALKEMAEESQN